MNGAASHSITKKIIGVNTCEYVLGYVGTKTAEKLLSLVKCHCFWEASSVKVARTGESRPNF